MDVLTILKGESGVDYGDNHTFVTESSESFCGVYLELDTEYLIDFSRDEDDGLLHANSCGLARKWSSVNAVDLADLESGCGTSNSTMTDDDVDDDGGGASDGAGGTNGTTTDDSNSASDEEETPVDEQVGGNWTPPPPPPREYASVCRIFCFGIFCKVPLRDMSLA